MSEILTKKIYSKDKTTGVETQVYPETNPASVVGLGDFVDGKITTAVNGIETVSETTVGNMINTAVGQIHTSESTSSPLANFNFANSDQLTEGTYIVTNPTNSPFDGEDGVLKVISTGTNRFVHTWNGKKYTGYREFGTFNPLEAGVESITVNGVAVDTAISIDGNGDPIYNAQNVGFSKPELDTTNEGNIEKIMWLKPGGTYTLSGVLINCQIRIGYLSTWYKNNSDHSFNSANFDIQNDNAETTTIILNNFYHKMNNMLTFDPSDIDSYEAAMGAYQPLIISEIKGKTRRRGKIVIELATGTKNYLVREMLTGMNTANNKWGVIYSDQDIDIRGTGYLGISDGDEVDDTIEELEEQGRGHLLGGHAIKAKGILHIYDAPHISANVYHDILHGNDGLYVEGGYFQAIYCNDILGTDTSRGDMAVGKVRVYNGVFDIRKCFGTFAQVDDGIFYPGIKIYFNTIGEGLWLECADGFVKGDLSLKGQCGEFGKVDTSNNVFKYFKLKNKLDGPSFTDYSSDVETYAVKTFKNADKFSKRDVDVYTFDGTSYTLVPSDAEYDSNTTYYTYACTATVTYRGVSTEVLTTKTIFDMYGIRVYNGITVTPDADGYTYIESARNTHVNTLINSDSSILAYNKNLTYTETSVDFANELTVAQAAALVSSPLSIEDAHFDLIDYEYAGAELSGGVWNKGITEEGLSEYKNKVDSLFSSLIGMIVPPKSVAISNIASAEYDIDTLTFSTEGVTNYRDDEIISEVEIKKGTTYNGQTVKGKVAAGGYIHTAKSQIEPTFTVHVGESVRISALPDPLNVTNPALRWSACGLSEELVIGRELSEDTMYCDFRGIQPGREDFILSTKALNKDNLKVELKIHFNVVDDKYTVSFDANEGTGEMAAITDVAGEYTLPECTFVRPGNTGSDNEGFCGWSIIGSGIEGEDELQLPAGVKIKVWKNITLKANWGPVSPAEPQVTPGE